MVSPNLLASSCHLGWWLLQASHATGRKPVAAPTFGAAAAENLHRCLQDCLRLHTGLEVIQDSGCPSCGQKRSKQISLSRCPPVLTLTVKRFEWRARAAGFQNASKDNTPVQICRTLDIAEFCTAEARGSTLYDLMGVVSHEGSPHSGHYFADVRAVGGATWYRCSDTHVAKVEAPGSCASSQPYLMLYARREA